MFSVVKGLFPLSLQLSFPSFRKVLMEWSKIPELKILGSKTEPRLGIISFMVEHLETVGQGRQGQRSSFSF